jgi:hypothetical protein
MSSKEVMRSYLQRLGQAPLSVNSIENAGSEIREPDAEDTKFLRDLVSQQAALNRKVLALGLSMIAVVFVITIVAGSRSGFSNLSLLTSTGLGGSAETGLFIWVFYLWREYNRFAFLLLLCQSNKISANEVMKVVGEMSFADKKRRVTGRGSPRVRGQETEAGRHP